MTTGPKIARKALKEDKVYFTLASLADYIVRYRLWVGAGAIGLLLVFAAGYYGQIRLRQKSQSASWALYKTEYIEDPSEKTTALKEVVDSYGRTFSARLASFKLAETLYDEGRFEDAMKEFQEFARRNPSHILGPSALEAVGYCQESLGRWNDALATYQSVMRKYPEGPVSMRSNYRIGLCYEQLGEAGKAIEAYEAAVASAPDSLWAEYSTERMTALRSKMPEDQENAETERHLEGEFPDNAKAVDD